jgi:uncharacterized RDD family membrane protein YckC
VAILVLNTLQNVKIEFEVASIGQRILARIIDFIIIVVYVFVEYHFFDSFEDLVEPIPRSIRDYLGVVLLLVFNTPLLLYDVVLEYYFEGQTFGKQLVGIKVVQLDGTTPELKNYFLRWLLTFIELWPPIGFMGATGLVIMSITKSQQRLGDIAANTAVINLRSKHKFEDTIFRIIKQTYKPVYPQAIQLTDRDVTIINTILENHKSSSDSDKNGIYEKTASRVCEVLNISEAIESPRIFLETIIKDYNALVFEQQDQL